MSNIYRKDGKLYAGNYDREENCIKMYPVKDVSENYGLVTSFLYSYNLQDKEIKIRSLKEMEALEWFSIGYKSIIIEKDGNKLYFFARIKHICKFFDDKLRRLKGDKEREEFFETYGKFFYSINFE